MTHQKSIRQKIKTGSSGVQVNCVLQKIKKKKKEIKLLFNLKNKRVTMDTNVVYRSNVLDGTSFSGIMISDDR